MAPQASSSTLDKIATDQPGRGGALWRCVFNRRNLAGLAGAALGGPGLQLGKAGAVAGYCVARWVYSHTEQYVPFTRRRHVILLPSVAEALLGQHLYESFLVEQHKKGTLLDASHPDTKLVSGVAERLIAVLSQGHGGGYQKHLRNFSWSVSVVKEPIANAFVFPGGYIVVYVGLLQLLRRDPDLLAMVMGHEIAHALARHNTEKMGFGIAISMAIQMLLTVVGAGASAEAQRQRQQQLEQERMRRGYHRTHSARLAAADDQAEGSSGLPAGAAGAAAYPSVPRPDVPPIDYRAQQQQQAAARTRANKGRQAQPDAAPQLPSWMSEQLLRSLTNVLLELPFSRRAETEADLIGLKLMTLAGYDPNKGPEAFTLLASASGSSRKGGAEALMAGLGCTHPDSNRRAELLNKELQWMAANRDAARESVGAKVDYFSL